MALTPSAPSLQTTLFCRETNFPCHSTNIKLFLLFNATEASYLSWQVLLHCWEVIFSLVPAIARRFVQGTLVGTSDSSIYRALP
jgi:hypothetical protein